MILALLILVGCLVAVGVMGWVVLVKMGAVTSIDEEGGKDERRN